MPWKSTFTPKDLVTEDVDKGFTQRIQPVKLAPVSPWSYDGQSGFMACQYKRKSAKELRKDFARSGHSYSHFSDLEAQLLHYGAQLQPRPRPGEGREEMSKRLWEMLEAGQVRLLKLSS